jgi:hypothetical protein
VDLTAASVSCDDHADGEGDYVSELQSSAGLLFIPRVVAKQEEMVNLALRCTFVHTSKGFSAGRKILRHGADGFTSPPKEGVLWIFIAPKNSSSWLGLNPRTLGPLTNMLTARPPRTTNSCLASRLLPWLTEYYGVLHPLV